MKKFIEGLVKGLVLAVLVAMVPGGPLSAQAAGQGIMYGNWKLIVAKSDFGGGPKLMAMTARVTSDTAGLIQFSIDQTTENGMTVSYSYKGAADGKEYPIIGSSSAYSYTEEPGVVHETQKDADGTITRGDFTVAANPKTGGKIGTWLYTITNPDGSTVKQKLVFESIQ